jgi:hypothetical protein
VKPSSSLGLIAAAAVLPYLMYVTLLRSCVCVCGGGGASERICRSVFPLTCSVLHAEKL